MAKTYFHGFLILTPKEKQPTIKKETKTAIHSLFYHDIQLPWRLEKLLFLFFVFFFFVFYLFLVFKVFKWWFFFFFCYSLFPKLPSIVYFCKILVVTNNITGAWCLEALKKRQQQHKTRFVPSNESFSNSTSSAACWWYLQHHLIETKNK